MTVWTTLDSPLGELLLVGHGTGDAFALESVSVPGQKGGAEVHAEWRRDPAPFREAAAQLRAYFAGERTRFDLPFAPGGTDFQRRVWAALETVPFGTTTTYGELAAEIGASRGAVRAVGTAIGRNPLLVVRPCHRVIGSDGSLTGYAGGLPRKQLLLELEGVGVGVVAGAGSDVVAGAGSGVGAGREAEAVDAGRGAGGGTSGRGAA